jgi:O-antigen/teichoic acid export membrane protein
MAGSGALAYAFHVLAARALGPDAYGQIAVLWGAMYLAAVVLFRPLEQTASRAFADRLARGEEVRTIARAVVGLYGGIVLVGLLALALSWGVIKDRLFLGNGTMTTLLAAGVCATGLAYVVRGAAGGARWFGGYGLGLMADAVLRLALAVPLVFVASQNLAATAVAVAGLAGAAVPVYAGRRLFRTLFAPNGGRRFHLPAALRFAAPASVIAAADQLLVNGAPVLVMLEGGPDAATVAGVVFAATMLVRVPVYLFQGLAASLLPNLTRMHADDELHGLRRAVARTVGLLLALGGAIVVAALAVGPPALRLLFGEEYDVGRLELTVLGAGVGCYLAAATITQALLALDNGTRAAWAWCLSAAVFVGLFVGLPGSELLRVSIGFAVATLLGLAALTVVLVRRIERQ